MVQSVLQKYVSRGETFFFPAYHGAVNDKSNVGKERQVMLLIANILNKFVKESKKKMHVLFLYMLLIFII